MRYTVVLSFILAFTTIWILPSHTQNIASNLEIISNVTTGTNISSSSTADGPLEPVTSTIDSLGVNLDEATTTITNNDEESTVTPASSDSESSPISEVETGIEPKSISGAAASSDNAIGNPNEKLVSESDSAELNSDSSSDSDTTTQRQPLAVPTKQPTRLNMSLIDQIYTESHKDEAETIESWRKIGKKFKKGIGSLIGTVVPFALNMSQEAKISGNCSGAMLKWVLSMNQLKSWALRMLDASGKPVAGLLEGSLTMFGNYRQCVKLRVPDDDEIEFAGEFREYFRGKYCIIQAKPWLPEKKRFYNLNSKIKTLNDDGEENPWYEKTVFDELSDWALAFNYVNIRMDLCVPSQCTREDIQKAVSFLLKGIDVKARVLRCEMETDGNQGFNGATIESANSNTAFMASTYNGYDHISILDTITQLGWTLVPIIVIVLVLSATLLSLIMEDDNKTANKFKHTIKSLSLKRSVDSHLNVDYDQLADDKPLSLYGIRFILVLWVIFVESAVNLKFEYLRELLMLKDLIFWWPMQIVINSTLQFDSIILLTAFTMSYKHCLNDSVNSAKVLTKYVLDKFIRLMPSIMLMVAMVIILPLAYRGPVWNDYVIKQSLTCQSTGWINMVFLQNYLPFKEIVSK